MQKVVILGGLLVAWLPVDNAPIPPACFRRRPGWKGLSLLLPFCLLLSLAAPAFGALLSD